MACVTLEARRELLNVNTTRPMRRNVPPETPVRTKISLIHEYISIHEFKLMDINRVSRPDPRRSASGTIMTVEHFYDHACRHPNARTEACNDLTVLMQTLDAILR